MTHKLTEADKKYFESKCNEYIEMFGLFDQLWLFDYGSDILATDNQNASCSINDTAQYRILTLSANVEKFWSDKQRNLHYLAFHEVMEGMFGDAHVLALDRSATEKQIDAAFHAVIQRLWNFFQRYEVKEKKK